MGRAISSPDWAPDLRHTAILQCKCDMGRDHFFQTGLLICVTLQYCNASVIWVETISSRLGSWFVSHCNTAMQVWYGWRLFLPDWGSWFVGMRTGPFIAKFCMYLVSFKFHKMLQYKGPMNEIENLMSGAVFLDLAPHLLDTALWAIFVLGHPDHHPLCTWVFQFVVNSQLLT